MASTMSSFPLDFDLYNANEEQVLFITDDVAGQELTLEVTNTSDKPLSPVMLAAVSASEYHFELVFRPNTLYNVSPAINLKSDQFDLFMNMNQGSIQPNADGTLSLFFKSKVNWILQKNEKLRIKINNIRAEGTDGTRGTRVMLRYRNLLHTGNPDSFSGFREMHLNIVNHRGKQNIPLHVGFVGANTVLNDGKSPNILRLRISNASRKDVAIETSAKSKLILALEGGPPSEEWTLATDTQLDKAVIKYRPPGETDLIEATGTSVWEIPFVKLQKGRFLDIEITNLITDHPTGHAYLYVHYENIPGYWDGEVVVVIEKTPLVFKDKNVSIGTPNSEGKLTVVPPPDARGIEILSPSAGNTHLPWSDNWNYISGNGVIFRDKSNVEKIRIDTTANSIAMNYGPWGLTNNNFIEFKSGYKDDPNRGQVHLYAPTNYYENTPVITLTGNYGAGGQVGIGNKEPEAMLDVNGEIKSKKYQFLADSKWNGQNIDKSGEHIIKFGKRNDPYNVFDDANSRFVAPTSGYYFFSTNLTFGKGNDVGDGVIVGIFKNGNVNDANTTIIVLDPGLFKTATAQSVTSLMSLNQGDFVDVRLQGVDNSRFHISYNSFMGMLLSK